MLGKKGRLVLAVALGILGSLPCWAQTQKKVTEIEAVISSVGQRTITFVYERKGKMREEVVGIDDKTDIDKDGAKVKLKELQEKDKVLVKYERDAYTPAFSVKVVGKGELPGKKGGGD
jgi:hypothetical protein